MTNIPKQRQMLSTYLINFLGMDIRYRASSVLPGYTFMFRKGDKEAFQALLDPYVRYVMFPSSRSSRSSRSLNSNIIGFIKKLIALRNTIRHSSIRSLPRYFDTIRCCLKSRRSQLVPNLRVSSERDLPVVMV